MMLRFHIDRPTASHTLMRFIKGGILLTLWLVALPSSSQQVTVAFHQFKLPIGSWTNTASATLNGTVSAPPQSTTVCSGPMSEPQAAALANNGTLRLAAAGCKTTVVTDTPTLAVYTQECPIEHNTTTTLTKLNDRHMTTDIKLIQGSVTSLVHIDGVYNGPCTPAVTGPVAMPSKPSPEACEQITEGYKTLLQARSACDSMEEEAPRCRERMDSELNRLKIQIGICQQ